MKISASPALRLALALFALYVIWGSTYFAIKIGVASWPPLMMAGVRFTIAGCLMITVLLLKGHKLPTLRQALSAALIGTLLLAVGNGLVTQAEFMQVPSGIAAVMVATVPLFTLIFARMFGHQASPIEWLGVVVGLIGIILLNTGGNLTGNPTGALLVIIASLSWAFGSVLSRYLTLPVGLMAAAVEMIAAGVLLLMTSLMNGEKLSRIPDKASLLALIYLVLFGSIFAFSAYTYLLKYARPALATSYAYVNPVVAVMLGMAFAGERLTLVEWLALGIIIFAVVMVMLTQSLRRVKTASV
ncbi:drug/metabolite exporter YedA [Biostraticola tofi]|uniref:Carboxylate/amino acid/amine transporter n=1 Tax=Biostraticola tofi TaxID=466109 RepID=A0A4R3YPE5_9GAMM|nr:drug/metabolite exporter YedA [Biostraticola tofi]TCV93034.1 carboxylate/amino acid/amine transporter [Biostraticola tofi]